MNKRPRAARAHPRAKHKCLPYTAGAPCTQSTTREAMQPRPYVTAATGARPRTQWDGEWVNGSEGTRRLAWEPHLGRGCGAVRRGRSLCVRRTVGWRQWVGAPGQQPRLRRRSARAAGRSMMQHTPLGCADAEARAVRARRARACSRARVRNAGRTELGRPRIRGPLARLAFPPRTRRGRAERPTEARRPGARCNTPCAGGDGAARRRGRAGRSCWFWADASGVRGLLGGAAR